MRTIAITGAASGMGAATTKKLRDQGHRVITVDQRDADIVADLGTAEGRRQAIAEITSMSDGKLEGFVPFAGIGPLPGRPGSLVISVNYFGTVGMLDALRPLLAAGDEAAAVAISSNSTTCQPGIPVDLIEACLAGDEAAADKYDSLVAYPSSKADPKLGPLLEAFTMPVGRTGRPEEIAALVAYLLGPDARFFCGSLIFCDGGTDAMLHPHDYPSPWSP